MRAELVVWFVYYSNICCLTDLVSSHATPDLERLQNEMVGLSFYNNLTAIKN